MENGVHICSWSHDGDRYRVWVRARPAVMAEASSFEQADIALADAICGAYGDGEGVHEYDRPRPGPANVPGLITVVTSVTGNSFATEQNLNELYEAGWCPRCRSHRGARTAAPLRLSGIDSGMDGGRCMQSRVRFFSEGFLELLAPAERDACEWRRVERTGRTKKAFYELVGSQVQLREAVLSPLVDGLWNVSLADAQGDILALRYCELCGWESPSQYTFMPRGLPPRYVDFAALPEPIPACFTVGGSVCLSRARWSTLLGRPGTRGISSSEVGVVLSSLVDPNPPRELIPANPDREG